MSGTYIPVKGDRARRTWWLDTCYLDVDYVGRTWVTGIDEDGDEMVYMLDDTWVKTPVPLPERWINMTPIGVADSFVEKAHANEHATPDRIACIHVWTDGAGVDHIERVTE